MGNSSWFYLFLISQSWPHLSVLTGFVPCLGIIIYFLGCSGTLPASSLPHAFPTSNATSLIFHSTASKLSRLFICSKNIYETPTEGKVLCWVLYLQGASIPNGQLLTSVKSGKFPGGDRVQLQSGQGQKFIQKVMRPAQTVTCAAFGKFDHGWKTRDSLARWQVVDKKRFEFLWGLLQLWNEEKFGIHWILFLHFLIPEDPFILRWRVNLISSFNQFHEHKVFWETFSSCNSFFTYGSLWHGL